MRRAPHRCRQAWLAGLGLWLALWSTADQAQAQALEPAALKKAIEARHPGVPWVTTAELARWQQGPARERPRLLDARTAAEFAVSQLEHAVRIDPDAPDVSTLGGDKDARIVVYCSVGYRSAAVARRLQQAGFRHVYNLLGGLFQWANEGRPLFQGTRRASRVHPYDAVWGKLLAPERRAPL